MTTSRALQRSDERLGQAHAGWPFVVVALVMTALVMTMLLAAGSVGAKPAGQAQEFSKANTLLFKGNHLAGIESQSTLHYTFEKQGSLEAAFTDTIAMTVTADNAPDSYHTEFQYFSGSRHRNIPPRNPTTGNPVLVLFLQRDVNEMHRLTEGNWRYFQKQIKQALAKDARIEPVEFDFQGRQVKGKQITIQPYQRASHRSEFNKLKNKSYVFTLSDAVPGEVYSIRTKAAPSDAGAADMPLMEETLQFDHLEQARDQASASGSSHD